MCVKGKFKMTAAMMWILLVVKAEKIRGAPTEIKHKYHITSSISPTVAEGSLSSAAEEEGGSPDSWAYETGANPFPPEGASHYEPTVSEQVIICALHAAIDHPLCHGVVSSPLSSWTWQTVNQQNTGRRPSESTHEEEVDWSRWGYDWFSAVHSLTRYYSQEIQRLLKTSQCRRF